MKHKVNMHRVVQKSLDIYSLMTDIWDLKWKINKYNIDNALVLKNCVNIMQNNYILGISGKFLPIF